MNIWEIQKQSDGNPKSTVKLYKLKKSMETKLTSTDKPRSFQEIKEQVLGSVGTKERDEYELEFRAEMQKERIGQMIKQVRISRNLTQEELSLRILGKSDKAVISRWEKPNSNMTITTFFKVMEALDAKVTFDIKVDKKNFKIA